MGIEEKLSSSQKVGCSSTDHDDKGKTLVLGGKGLAEHGSRGSAPDSD